MKRKIMYLGIVSLLILLLLTGCSTNNLANRVLSKENYDEITTKYAQDNANKDEVVYFTYAITNHILKDGLENVLNLEMTEEQKEIETYKNIYGKTINQLVEEGKTLMKANNMTVDKYKENLKNLSNSINNDYSTINNNIKTNSENTIDELKLDSLNYDVYISENGDMHVTEIWNIEIQDTNTLFKTFILDNSKYNGISNVKVCEIIPSGTKKEFKQINQEMYHVTKDCYYALVNSNGEFEIAWGVDTKNQIKTYEISYTVNNAILMYNDCAELYWQFIGKGFEIPIDYVSGQIHLPNKVKNLDNIRVWGHSKADGEVIRENRQLITFKAEDCMDKDYLEIRVAILETEMFDASIMKVNKNMLQEIIEQEISFLEQ